MPHLRSLFHEVSDGERQGLSPARGQQRRDELSTVIQERGDTARGPRAGLKTSSAFGCVVAFSAGAARVTQEAEIPLV